MADRIVASFKLHLRCECCFKESWQTFDVPDVMDAPRTVADLLESGALQHQPYKCRTCDSGTGNLIGVEKLLTPTVIAPSEATEGRSKTTVYVVVGFRPDRNGKLIKEGPITAISAGAAERRAEGYAAIGGGGIATSQTGCPKLGDWDPPAILAKFGRIPRSALNEITEAA